MLTVRCGADGIETVESPAPEPSGDHEVVVTVTSAGICNTDQHLIAAGLLHVTPGHEFAGRLETGELVAVQPYVACGSCRRCAGGRGHLCAEVQSSFYGVARPGGMAEQVVVDRRTLVPLPAGVDPQEAALVEPLAVVLHGLHRLADLNGQPVLVIGAGAIGLLAVAAARALGATVDLAARHPAQRDAGTALGAGVTVGRDYRVVIDAAGTQSSLDQAARAATPGGTVLSLAVPWDGVALPLAMVMREIDFRPAMLYGHHHGEQEFATAARMLADLPTLADVVVSHRFGLDRAAEAFATAADRSAGALKVHLVPGWD